VLPTETGKTETMLATQVYRRLDRSLVLGASDATIATKSVTGSVYVPSVPRFIRFLGNLAPQ
jgi:hypothetical protein